MEKSPEAFRTISEVADLLDTPAHVLRFWESRFPQIRPVKRAGGRRYYRPSDVALLAGIRLLLHDQGMTIRGVQKILREQGVRHVCGLAGDAALRAEAAQDWATEDALVIDAVALTAGPPVAAGAVADDRVIAWPGPRPRDDAELAEAGEDALPGGDDPGVEASLPAPDDRAPHDGEAAVELSGPAASGTPVHAPEPEDRGLATAPTDSLDPASVEAARAVSGLQAVGPEVTLDPVMPNAAVAAQVTRGDAESSVDETPAIRPDSAADPEDAAAKEGLQDRSAPQPAAPPAPESAPLWPPAPDPAAFARSPEPREAGLLVDPDAPQSSLPFDDLPLFRQPDPIPAAGVAPGQAAPGLATEPESAEDDDAPVVPEGPDARRLAARLRALRAGDIDPVLLARIAARMRALRQRLDAPPSPQR